MFFNFIYTIILAETELQEVTDEFCFCKIFGLSRWNCIVSFSWESDNPGDDFDISRLFQEFYEIIIIPLDINIFVFYLIFLEAYKKKKIYHFKFLKCLFYFCYKFFR